MATMRILIHLKLVSVDFLGLHLPPVTGSGLIITRGDSWVIPVDKDILTPEPAEKSTDKEDQFSESKLMSHIRGPYSCDYSTTQIIFYVNPFVCHFLALRETNVTFTNLIIDMNVE